MSTPFQIAVDCAAPHRLVRFWAEAMGCEVEATTTTSRGWQLVDAGYVQPEDDAIEIDGRLARRTAADCRDPGPRPRAPVFPAGTRTQGGQQSGAP